MTAWFPSCQALFFALTLWLAVLGVGALTDLHWLLAAQVVVALVLLRSRWPLAVAAAVGAWAELLWPAWLALLVFAPAAFPHISAVNLKYVIQRCASVSR